MGHLIHPTGYRLGTSTKWKSSWVVNNQKLYRKYLHSDLTIYHFLNIFFRKYAIPNYTYTERRRTQYMFKNAKKISGLAGILRNSFVYNEFSFSHVQVIRHNGIGISCYLFDGDHEEWRLAFLNGLRRPTHRSSSMFFPSVPIKKYKNDLIFLSEMDDKSKMGPKVYKISRFLSLVLATKWSNLQERVLKESYLLLEKDCEDIYNIFRLRPMFLFQNDHNTYWNSPIILARGTSCFIILKVLLISIKDILAKDNKKQLFFIILLKNLFGFLLILVKKLNTVEMKIKQINDSWTNLSEKYKLNEKKHENTLQGFENTLEGFGRFVDFYKRHSGKR
jgi:hypothetical protein